MTLKLRPKNWKTMVKHVSSTAPEEACGLVAGLGKQAELVIPVTNQLASTERFFMDPVELLRGLEKIEQSGLELLAVYHSHPRGPDYPSSVDLVEYSLPETITIIWYPDDAGWKCKGFCIDNSQYYPIEMSWGSQE